MELKREELMKVEGGWWLIPRLFPLLGPKQGGIIGAGLPGDDDCSCAYS